MKNHAAAGTIITTRMHAAADTITITKMHAAVDTSIIMRSTKRQIILFDHAEKQVYILENLGCAHCASKMEEKIQALPQVEFAAITFATKQLQVVTNTDAELLEEFQKICASIESEVVVRKRDGGSTGNGSLQRQIFRK